MVQLAGDLTGTAATPLVANNAITSTKILDGTIATTDLADASITTVKLAANAVDLTSKVTATLPITNGGTNSSTALNNNRIMVSSAGAINEAVALTNGQLLVGSTGSAPVATSIIAGNGISITNGAGSVKIDNTPTIVQVTETSLITTTSTTFVPLSTPMAFTPGAGDYLIFFNAVVSNALKGTGTTMSIFSNGVQLFYTEMQATSGLASDKNTIAITAYVVGLQSGQAIEIRWKAESIASMSTITNRSLIIQKVK